MSEKKLNHYARSQASDTVYTVSAHFWDFTQRKLAVCYRDFGKTCRPYLQESSIPKLFLGGRSQGKTLNLTEMQEWVDHIRGLVIFEQTKEPPYPCTDWSR
jgi:hypothetical protein